MVEKINFMLYVFTIYFLKDEMPVYILLNMNNKNSVFKITVISEEGGKGRSTKTSQFSL